jgi:hypothetical protein
MGAWQVKDPEELMNSGAAQTARPALQVTLLITDFHSHALALHKCNRNTTGTDEPAREPVGINV